MDSNFENGNIIEQNFNIKNRKVEGIKNWEKAIFASPSINIACFYSCPYFDVDPFLFNCLIEVKIKPKSFTNHVKRYSIELGEMECACPYEDYIIYRIPSEKDIVVKSILFIKKISERDDISKSELLENGYKD